MSLDMSSNQTLKSSPSFALFAKASATLLQERLTKQKSH